MYICPSPYYPNYLHLTLCWVLYLIINQNQCQELEDIDISYHQCRERCVTKQNQEYIVTPTQSMISIDIHTEK